MPSTTEIGGVGSFECHQPFRCIGPHLVYLYWSTVFGEKSRYVSLGQVTIISTIILLLLAIYTSLVQKLCFVVSECKLINLTQLILHTTISDLYKLFSTNQMFWRVNNKVGV